jgi:hypothetical protein
MDKIRTQMTRIRYREDTEKRRIFFQQKNKKNRVNQRFRDSESV